MNIFDGIENVSYFQRGKNIPEGTHILIGKKFTTNTSAKNRAVQNFVAEFTVESSNSPELAPGDTVSVVYASSNASFLKNVKYLLSNYMFACERAADPNVTLSQIENKLNSEYIEYIIKDGGTTYAGSRIKSIGRMTTIKTGPNAGSPYIAHEWDQA